MLHIKYMAKCLLGIPLLFLGGSIDVFSREGEGQHTTDHFRVGRNSLDIFSPVRDGEETFPSALSQLCPLHVLYVHYSSKVWISLFWTSLMLNQGCIYLIKHTVKTVIL